MQSQDSEKNQRILDMTRELCMQLGISNYSPTFVSWEDLDSRRRRRRGSPPVEFPADDCLIEKYCVTLPASMKTVLEPDDWRPIIASSLIFSKLLRRKLVTRAIVTLAGFLSLAVALFLELPTLLPQPVTSTSRSGVQYTAPLGSMIAGILSLVLVPMGTSIVSVVYARRLRLQADRRAADAVSVTAFLATLKKISEGKPGTANRRGGFVGSPIPLLPSLRARMARIESYSQP